MGSAMVRIEDLDIGLTEQKIHAVNKKEFLPTPRPSLDRDMFWASDTQELFIYDMAAHPAESPIVITGAEGLTSVIHNNSMFGSGVQSDPLRGSIPDYNFNNTYHQGDVVSATFDSIKDIYRLDYISTQVWTPSQVDHYLGDETKEWAAGSQFYIDAESETDADPSLYGIYQANIDVAAREQVTSLIDNGEIIKISQITQWIPNEEYQVGNQVYRFIEGEPFYKVIYTAIRVVSQPEFSLYVVAIVWNGLTKEEGQGSSVPPGGIITWSAALPVPNSFLRCDGEQVPKLAYPLLFDAIGETFGPATSVLFTLPLIDNAVIKS